MDNLLIEKLNLLLRQVSIISLFKDHYKVVHRGGSKYTVQCPFHKDGNEANPSMSVDDDLGLYKCFACGASGNVITYLREKEGLAFKDAVLYLGRRFSVDTSGFFTKRVSHKDMLYAEMKKINDFACLFFDKSLLSKNKSLEYVYSDAVEYLKKRKIPFGVLKEFKIGFAPPKWDALLNSLRNVQGVDIKNMLEVGVVRESRKSQGKYFDNFINRIIFPIINERDEIIGFGGRSIDGSEPKYLNSKESILFKKKYVLYGINVARSSIMKLDSALVVEGYMDVITCHKMGVTNAIATLGTAITDEHITHIKKYTSNIVFALDNDDAGVRATKNAIYNALKFAVKVYIIDFEGAKDLDEYFSSKSKEDFDLLEEKKLAWYEWLLMTSLRGLLLSDMKIEERLSTANMFHRYLSCLESNTEKDLILGYIADKLNIEYNSLKKDYQYKITNGGNKFSKIESKNRNNDYKKYENGIIYLLTINPWLIPIAEKEISPDLLKKDIVREFYIRLLTLPSNADFYQALSVLANENVSNRIKLKSELYKEDAEEKLKELIVKIKGEDIDNKRDTLKREDITSPLKSEEGFEAICGKAREIYLLNKEKEKLYQGKNL